MPVSAATTRSRKSKRSSKDSGAIQSSDPRPRVCSSHSGTHRDIEVVLPAVEVDAGTTLEQRSRCRSFGEVRREIIGVGLYGEEGFEEPIGGTLDLAWNSTQFDLLGDPQPMEVASGHDVEPDVYRTVPSLGQPVDGLCDLGRVMLKLLDGGINLANQICDVVEPSVVRLKVGRNGTQLFGVLLTHVADLKSQIGNRLLQVELTVKQHCPPRREVVVACTSNILAELGPQQKTDLSLLQRG